MESRQQRDRRRLETAGEKEHPGVSDLLSEKTPIRARHIRPGQGQAVEVKTGQLLQIQTLQGKQVADFVAFTQGDTDEFLSTSVTRAEQCQHRSAAAE